MSGELAATLQRWLERFATPWYRPRRLRMFRDYTNLSANDNLPQSLRRALSDSRWLVLLASPRAAHSRWVNDEVAWWRENRRSERVCVALTSGELAWDDEARDWNWEVTDALPPAARGMFAEQPLWVDLRQVTSAKLDRSNVDLRNKVAQIAAPLHGVDKDTIVGEHIVLERRARLQRRGGVTGLALLLVAALIAAYLAVGNAQEAQAQSRIAQARALAAAADANRDTNLDVAQLLAVEAYRMDPSAETRTALLRAVTASPHLVRYLQADSDVQRVAGSADRKFLVAGTKSGHVLRWDTKTYTTQVVARLGRPVTGLAMSAAGDTVVATDGSTALLWTGKGAARKIPAGSKPSLVGVSPSGRSVVTWDESGEIALFDGGLQRRAREWTKDDWQDLAVPSDRELVLFEGANGTWERRGIPALARDGSASVGFGTANYAYAFSPGGGSFTYSNGDTWLPLWNTGVPTGGLDDHKAEATSRGPRPTALAISHNGRRVATATSGSIVISEVTPAGKQRAEAREISAAGAVNRDALSFVGDTEHVISASGKRVAFWDLSQPSRITERADIAFGPPCNACTEPWLTVGPDQETVAVSDVSGLWVTVHAPAFSHSYESEELTPQYGPPVFGNDGRTLVVPLLANGGAEVRAVSAGVPLRETWPASHPAGAVKAASLSLDRKRFVTVTDTDVVLVRDAANGRVLREIPAPEGSGQPFEQLYVRTAAIDPTASRAAIVTESGVRLVDIERGTAQEISLPGAMEVQFAGSYLAVQQEAGRSIRLWNLRDRRFERTVGDDRELEGAFAISGDGSLLAQRLRDDSVAITNIENDETVGTLDLGAPYLAAASALAFTGDNRTLYVAVEGSGDIGELQRWSLAPATWGNTACASSGRDLSRSEWRKYVGTTPPPDLRCRR
ncbi:TIR domain-containing protein [Streptomyces sp. NBC_00306]|uniref:TIR domain-containing protein n=1 Tax=Streptomyces sp. NBC_00306 TaxID=2975708 RepID=UPI002E29AB32|nr:TIR domain-containing protein [Streptomyces sp. NBC_00306]